MNLYKKLLKSRINRWVALFLTASLLIVMPGCNKKNNGPERIPGSSILPLPTKPITEATTNSSNEIVIRGVFSALDAENKKMRFVDISTNVEYEVPYHGGTDIRNRYETIIAAVNMRQGEIFDVTCDSGGVAKSIYGAKDSWEQRGLTGVQLDETKKLLEVGALSLKYNTSTLVLSGGDKISIASVVAQDEITLRGVDSTVYSVTVDKGHGYLRLTGIDTFVDGYVSIGKSQLLKVSSGMLITAQIGTYVVEIQKGSIRADKMITIENGQEASLDFSEYVKPAVQNGVVRFKITPEDAILSIDGIETDYSDLVKLSYGTHQIQVKASKYAAYSENYVVDSAYETKIIDLTEKNAATAKTNSSSNNNKVNVTAPAGATLYVDGAYVGVIPCSFAKRAGNRTVTISRTGYETQSYSITFSSDDADVSYAFPALTVKKNTIQ